MWGKPLKILFQPVLKIDSSMKKSQNSSQVTTDIKPKQLLKQL